MPSPYEEALQRVRFAAAELGNLLFGERFLLERLEQIAEDAHADANGAAIVGAVESHILGRLDALRERR